MTAFSNPDINWITICPTTFSYFPTIPKAGPNEDILGPESEGSEGSGTDSSDDEEDIYIDDMLSLSTVLFHEFLHILHEYTSK